MKTFKIAEAAKVLGVSQNTVLAEIRRGNLPVLRLSPRVWKIPAAAVLRRLEPIQENHNRQEAA